MSKQVERLEAQISVDDKASKKLETMFNSMTKQMNKMDKVMKNNDAQMLRMKTSMEKLRVQGNKKIEPKVDTKKAQGEVNRLTKALVGLQKVAGGTGRVLGGMGSALTPSMGGIIGGAATVGAAGYGMSQAVSSTVGQSLEYNMISKQVELIGKTRKLDGKKVMDLADQTSLTSIFDNKEILNTFAGMMSYSKNENQVKKLADMAQLLAYTDPMQGMSGGKLAIQELLSGDAKSMYMRFEKVPKAVADELATFADKNNLTKGNNLDKFIDLFNKRMTSTGFDQNFVKEIENTPYGKWLSGIENVQITLRKIGDATLPRVTKMLDKFNDAMKNGGIDRTSRLFGKLADNIGKLAERGLDSFISNAPKLEKGLDKWFTKFGNTVDGFLSGDLTLDKMLNNWITGGINGLDKAITDNQKTIENSISTMIQFSVSAIEKNTSTLVEAAVKLGAATAKGLVNGLASDPIASAIVGMTVGGTVAGPWGMLVGGLSATAASSGYVMNKDPKVKALFDDLQINSISPDFSSPIPFPKKAVGMKRVPYNNYPALLHEGERVLTKQEANQSNKPAGVTVQVGDVHIHNEMDYQTFIKRLVNDISDARVVFGGSPA
jgi:hypothetical protein